MPKWNQLAPDLKMCVTIFQEQSKGHEVWNTRLLELLKNDLTRTQISMLEDRLMDLGVLDKQWKSVDGKWTYCYRICKCTEFLIKNVVENLEA
jgi:hypothetical protein